MVVAVMMPQLYFYPQVAQAVSAPDLETIQAIQYSLNPPKQTFEQISAPLVKAGERRQYKEDEKACQRRGGLVKNGWCRLKVQPTSPEPKPLKTAVNSPITPLLGAVGGGGYMLPGYNCVACVIQLTGRGQNGNAGQWIPSHSTPRVGDIMIFYPGEQGASWAGHVAVVQGINSNGTINVAHCNWGSGQTTFYSTGKFW